MGSVFSGIIRWFRFSKRVHLIKVALFALLLMGTTSGCIMIPAGSRKTKRDTTGDASFVDSSGYMKFRLDPEGKLCVYGLPGTPTIRNLPGSETVVNSDFIVIGFYPAICASWCAGEPMDSSFRNDLKIGLFGIPLVNLITVGGISVIGWFDEFGASWTQHQYENRISGLSLVGWSKSSRRKVVKDLPKVSKINYYAVVSLPETGTSQIVRPDKEGWCKVQLASLKPPVDRPWALCVAIPETKPEIRTYINVFTGDAFK